MKNFKHTLLFIFASFILSGCISNDITQDLGLPKSNKAETNAIPTKEEKDVKPNPRTVALTALDRHIDLTQEKFDAKSKLAKVPMETCDTFQLSISILMKHRKEFEELGNEGLDPCFVEVVRYGTEFGKKPQVVIDFFNNIEEAYAALAPEKSFMDTASSLAESSISFVSGFINKEEKEKTVELTVKEQLANLGINI